MQHTDISFLTWMEHRRTREISARLGFELTELVTKRRGWRRYVELTCRTIAFLTRRKPRVLIVQSPSIVCALVTVLLRPWVKYKLVIDAHNEAVEPYLHRSIAIRWLSEWLLRKANLVIVSNAVLSERVVGFGGKPIALMDSIPEPPVLSASRLSGRFNAVLISTFAGDEPFDAVVAATKKMPEDVHVYVTGNPARVPPELRAAIPRNMTLTGFLAEHDYWTLLASCDLVIDLTTMPNCLVCGAYEAVAVEKPSILSANDASHSLFYDTALFTDNSVESLLLVFKEAIDRHATLMAGMPIARKRIEALWERSANELMSQLRA